MVAKPRYLSKRKLKGRRYEWVFQPPKDVLEKGISKKKTFKDFRVAKSFALRELEKIDEYREGIPRSFKLSYKSTISRVADHYLNSSYFSSLSPNTKRAYRQWFKSIVESQAPGLAKFGNCKLSRLSVSLCQDVYDLWVGESTSKALTLSRAFSVLMSHCLTLELISRNPMSSIKKVKHEPTTQTWTPEQVDKFLSTAFSEFKWRNVGLIVLMSYEWCQRPTDIRSLRWEDVDFSEGCVSITQSKRGAEVVLPISDDLLDLLKKQKEDFGFQEYVVPNLGLDKVWKEMTPTFMTSRVNEVLEEAGLPSSLSAGTLRKTGIQELVDADVDTAAIMSVTGHKNIQSLNPYIKPKLSTATMALNKRKSK